MLAQNTNFTANSAAATLNEPRDFNEQILFLFLLQVVVVEFDQLSSALSAIFKSNHLTDLSQNLEKNKQQSWVNFEDFKITQLTQFYYYLKKPAAII